MSGGLNYNRDAIRDALLSSLGTVYDCTRTWSAWGHGTMGPDDFRPFDQQDDRIEEVVDAIVATLPQLPDRLIFSERLAISQTAHVSVDDECNRIIQATLDHIRSNHANPAVPAQAAAKCDGNHGGPRCADPECWNDSPPASDPLKDNQIAALVNKVCRLAREFHNHDSLRQRIAQELVPVLKAAPAPVVEGDGPNLWWICEASNPSSGAVWKRQPDADDIAWVTKQSKRPHVALRLVPERTASPATQATPEPKVRLTADITDPAVQARLTEKFGDMQVTPEPVGEPDCWAILTPNGSRLVPPAEAKGRKDAYPLYTRPAPGVPEAVVGLVRFMETAFVPMTPQQEEIKKSLALASASLAAQAKGGR